MAMTIGAGITLIVLGLILLLRVVEVDLPYIDDYALGILLTLAGIAGIVLSLTIWRSSRGRIVERRIERDDII
jgi:hypothetical protein